MTMTFRSTITSNQRAFNAVCRHLAAQKTRARTRLTNPSHNPDHHAAYACEYFNPTTGHFCAIGALLTRSSAQYAEYHYSGEGIASIAAYISPSPRDLGLSEELLENLQTAHDQSDTLTELHSELHAVADTYGLNPAAISSITEWK
jgi:hypothetical protein